MMSSCDNKKIIVNIHVTLGVKALGGHAVLGSESMVVVVVLRVLSDLLDLHNAVQRV